MILQPKIEEYLLQLHPKRVSILQEMEDFGYSINFPILGPIVGNILYQYALIIGARRILELGSGFGYSAFWFAMALPDDGEIHCTDFSAKNKEKAEGYFERAGLRHKLKFHVGDALDYLKNTDGPFDIILNDVQKTRYPEVFKPALAKLRPGGLLITDNALWKGKVADFPDDEETRAIRQFNRMIFTSEEVVSSILPVRDGLAVCYKKL